MLNQDKINKVKGILSACKGALVPKFLNPWSTLGEEDWTEYESWKKLPGNEEKSYWDFKVRKKESMGTFVLSNAGTMESLDPTTLDTNKDKLEKTSELSITGDKVSSALAAVNQTANANSSIKEKTYEAGTLPEVVVTPTPKAEQKQELIELLQAQTPAPSNEPPALTSTYLKSDGVSVTPGTSNIDPAKIKVPKSAGDLGIKTPESTSTKISNFMNSKGVQTAGKVGSAVGATTDLLSAAFVNKADYASDDPTLGLGRQTYDAVANSLMAFSPIGTIAGGAMKAVGLINDIGGSKADSFSIDTDTRSTVGGSYGGSYSDIDSAASKAGKKYGLFAGGARRKANKEIAEAKRLLNIMSGIAKEARDRADSSTMLSLANAFSYQFQMNGGYDLRYLHAAKSGAKLLYFKSDFKIHLSDPDVQETLSIFKKGGTLLDKLDIEANVKLDINLSEPILFEVNLSEPNSLESYKKGGAIKDREIEVIETNTTQKSVIPEGALHKNKHHLDEVGVDDSELTKKGIPVVDNEGDQQAEIELNEIIFTLEVTKELESRYKEFYAEGTSESKKDELAIEAGKLLWKEILYNTDDRTGLIDTLKQGGTIGTPVNKNPSTKYLKGGGMITLEDINQMVKQALLNLLTK